MAAWKATLGALLALTLRMACAADGAETAARELARKSAAFAGSGEAAGMEWDNRSSLGAAELARIRAAFEAGLKQAGGKLSAVSAATTLRLTLSEDPARFLLVEEARKGDQHTVWISSWLRSAVTRQAPRATLEKRLLLEQDEQILDAVTAGDLLLLLTRSHVEWYARQENRWARSLSIPLPTEPPLPRDARGKLRVSGGALQAFLPGIACTGTWQPPATLECKPSDAPWTLESGQNLILAQFAPGRNYFDGRIVMQSGARKQAQPFFTAAAVQDAGKTLWALPSVGGSARLFDESLNPLGEIENWGSDVARVSAACAPGGLILASRAGNGSTDSLQSFSISGLAAEPFSAPLDLPGPVTALWSAGPQAALAVSRDSDTGTYAAYLITVTCGE